MEEAGRGCEIEIEMKRERDEMKRERERQESGRVGARGVCVLIGLMGRVRADGRVSGGRA